jgi:hypothetical protein
MVLDRFRFTGYLTNPQLPVPGGSSAIRKLLVPKTKPNERLGHLTNPNSVYGTNEPMPNLHPHWRL